MNRTILLVAAAMIGGSVLVWLWMKKRKSEAFDPRLPLGLPSLHGIEEALPTEDEKLFINGEYDTHIVDSQHRETIRQGDIALGEGFGVGPGTFGFGRHAGSMMA